MAEWVGCEAIIAYEYLNKSLILWLQWFNWLDIPQTKAELQPTRQALLKPCTYHKTTSASGGMPGIARAQVRESLVCRISTNSYHARPSLS